MNKLLVIVGPTGTGKTKLALYLGKVLNGEVISADSRQVYKFMDIGTGKEGNVLGYDLVNPNEEFSVSQYLDFAESTIENIKQGEKLPILVGGTGLYIKALVDGISSKEVPPDKKLREELESKTTKELLEILEKIDSKKANSMNESDRKNPRRLIRAIEIAEKFLNSNFKILKKRNYDVLFIGLTADKESLRKRIEKRVDERIKMGFGNEIFFLKENGYWDGAPQRTLGYKDWPDIKKWKLEEFKYAKRQITWFKKDIRINWLDVTREKWQDDVEKLVSKWYSSFK